MQWLSKFLEKRSFVANPRSLVDRSIEDKNNGDCFFGAAKASLAEVSSSTPRLGSRGGLGEI
jgi:hypothetical protein